MVYNNSLRSLSPRYNYRGTLVSKTYFENLWVDWFHVDISFGGIMYGDVMQVGFSLFTRILLEIMIFATLEDWQRTHIMLFPCWCHCNIDIVIWYRLHDFFQAKHTRFNYCPLLTVFSHITDIDIASKDDSILARVKNMTIEGYSNTNSNWNSTTLPTVGMEDLDPINGIGVDDPNRALNSKLKPWNENLCRCWGFVEQKRCTKCFCFFLLLLFPVELMVPLEID